MAKYIKVISQLAGQQVASPFPVTVPVEAGTTASIKPGMLVITANAGYWGAAPDGTDTDTLINAGIATSESTETATANGTVTIDTAQVMVVQLFAATPGSLAAASKGVAWVLTVSAAGYLMNESSATKGIFNLLDYDNTTNGYCTCLLTTHWRG